MKECCVAVVLQGRGYSIDRMVWMSFAIFQHSSACACACLAVLHPPSCASYPAWSRLALIAIFFSSVLILGATRMTYVRATFDYEATEPQELTMAEGDIIEVIAEDASGWWSGRLDGQTGLFPSNFCEPYEGGDEEYAEDPYEEEPYEEPEERDVPPQQRGTVGVNPLAGMAMGELAGALASRRNKGPSSNMEEQIKKNKSSSGGVNKALKQSRKKPAQPAVDTENLVIAKHDYQGAPEDDELSFSGDQMITVLKRDDSGWWQGELDSEVGWFPCTFVRALTDEEARAMNPEVEEPEVEPEEEPVVKRGNARAPRGPGGGPASKRAAKKGPKKRAGAKAANKRAPQAQRDSGPSQADLDEAVAARQQAESRVKQLEDKVAQLEAELEDARADSESKIETIRGSLQTLLNQL